MKRYFMIKTIDEPVGKFHTSFRELRNTYSDAVMNLLKAVANYKKLKHRLGDRIQLTQIK